MLKIIAKDDFSFSLHMRYQKWEGTGSYNEIPGKRTMAHLKIKIEHESWKPCFRMWLTKLRESGKTLSQDVMQFKQIHF